MRVCPKCGYHDNPLWRHSLKVAIDFMPLSDFELLEPIIAEKAKSQKYVENGPFVYHLTKGLNVERQAIVDNPSFKERWALPMEAHSKSKMKTYARILSAHKRNYQQQTKLLEP